MDAEPPYKRAFTLQIDVAVDAQVFVAPSFRFRFLEGSKKQTPVVGAAGWSPVPSPPSESNESNGADDSSPSDDAASGVARPLPDTFRFEQLFADVAVTEAFATALDDDPMVSVFFADHPGLASGGATAAASQPKDAKGNKSAAPSTPEHGSGADAKTPRAYAGVYDVDASSLLAGHLVVEQTWAPETPTRDDSHALADVFSPKQPKPTRAASQSLFFLLPPAESAGLKYLAIRILVDQPLLSSALAKKLNPLTISLASARRLPGITTTSSSRTLARSPHVPLRQLCRPVYAMLQFFPDKLRSPHTGGCPIPRVIATPGKPQEERVDWDHRVTFLSARFNRAELLDALQFAALTVEVHDRDLTQADRMRRLVAKWEALYATGVDITAAPGSRAAETVEPSSSVSRTTSPRPGATHAQPQQSKPMELFAVDEIARRDCQQLLLRAAEFFPHGLASFRLNELLNSAKQLVGSRHESRPFLSLKLAADVVSVKRRAKPLGAGVSDEDEDPLAVFDLTPTEKLVREPGAYLASTTTFSIRVTLQHPVNPLPGNQLGASADAADTADELSSPRPSFSRMVLVIPYDDNRTLTQVSRVMAGVNLAALPGVPICSYQLTESEKQACESGELDVVTGAQVIDTRFRTIILEGLAGGAMKRVHELIPRQAANDPDGYRMCASDHVLFPQRLYTAFELDLKRIKLRYPLPTLLNSPDIYMRSKVSENCFKALMRLADLRHASRLEEAKRLDLFPTAQMLVEVESKYGESITLDDIHGRGHAEGRAARDSTRHQPALAHDLEPLESPSPETSGCDDMSASNNHDDGGARKPNATTASRRHPMTLKAPTDSTNDTFEETRKTRKDKDFLSERRKESDAVRSEYSEKKKLLADAQLLHPSQPVYMYSGQKLRTQDALQDEMRKRLAKDRLATYTYSAEFQSLAVSLVDPDALRQTEELESRKKWTTQRGFVYPLPRRPDEYYKHKDAPSEARCEDLRAPFVDNANHPKPVSRGEEDPSCASARRRASLPEFSTLPSKDMVFGGTNGDGTVNAEFFRSVHLCGEGLRQEQEEALKRELEAWERRLVVDRKQIKFLAHGNTTGLPREKPAQLDKISDILRGAARSKPIRIVKNATLPSGKRVPLEAPPVSIHNQQEFAGSVATQFATTLRQTDAARFLATNAATGKPKDFLFPSNTNLLTPEVKRHVTRKEVAPVAGNEKQGLVWRNE